MNNLLKNLVNFEGRSDKAEFWKVNLIVIFVSLIFQLISIVLNQYGAIAAQNDIDSLLSVFSFLSTIPLLALGSRRLHDIGKSGWWQLLAITIIGIIPLTIWFLRNGDKNENAYGPPK